jgi:hypothetical protein
MRDIPAVDLPVAENLTQVAANLRSVRRFKMGFPTDLRI